MTGTPGLGTSLGRMFQKTGAPSTEAESGPRLAFIICRQKEGRWIERVKEGTEGPAEGDTVVAPPLHARSRFHTQEE